MACNHQCANESHEVEQERSVTTDAVYDNPASTDKGSELYYCNQTGRQNTSEVQQDADLVLAEVEVVVAFSWCCAISALAGTIRWTEISGEVEVGKTS
jgi:hypothetical protein